MKYGFNFISIRSTLLFQLILHDIIYCIERKKIYINLLLLLLLY